MLIDRGGIRAFVSFFEDWISKSSHRRTNCFHLARKHQRLHNFVVELLVHRLPRIHRTLHASWNAIVHCWGRSFLRIESLCCLTDMLWCGSGVLLWKWRDYTVNMALLLVTKQQITSSLSEKDTTWMFWMENWILRVHMYLLSWRKANFFCVISIRSGGNSKNW